MHPDAADDIANSGRRTRARSRRRRQSLYGSGTGRLEPVGRLRREVRALPRAAAGEDGGNRAEEDLGVEREAPVVDVGEVEVDPLLEVPDVVPPRNLPAGTSAPPRRSG